MLKYELTNSKNDKCTILKLYGFNSKGFQIVSIPKCGTRYLDDTQKENYNELYKIQINEILNNKLKTYFVTRDPLQHMESALFTEILSRYKDEGEDVFNTLLSKPFGHWDRNMYIDLYMDYLLKKWEIEFIDLSELNLLLKKHNLYFLYEKEKYDFNLSLYENRVSHKVLGSKYSNYKIDKPLFTKQEAKEKLIKVNPKKYFDMEKIAINERYYLYLLKNKL